MMVKRQQYIPRLVPSGASWMVLMMRCWSWYAAGGIGEFVFVINHSLTDTTFFCYPLVAISPAPLAKTKEKDRPKKPHETSPQRLAPLLAVQARQVPL
jgi:hypothetical protein